MPSSIRVKTGLGEYTFAECQVRYEGNTLSVTRNGVPLLWASWPWAVEFL